MITTRTQIISRLLEELLMTRVALADFHQGFSGVISVNRVTLPQQCLQGRYSSSCLERSAMPLIRPEKREEENRI